MMTVRRYHAITVLIMIIVLVGSVRAYDMRHSVVYRPVPDIVPYVAPITYDAPLLWIW